MSNIILTTRFIDIDEPQPQQRFDAAARVAEFRARKAQERQPATDPASAITPALARLYSLWEQITPGLSNRAKVQEVRAMVAAKLLPTEPIQEKSFRSLTKKLRF